MKAVLVEKQGGPDVMEYCELAKPEPEPHEALIKLKAAGVNYIDIYIRNGDPLLPVPLPYIPGFEGSGIVEAVGAQVTEVKVGDRIAYTGVLGSYAEYITAPADRLIPLPTELSFEQGAAFPLQGLTAYYLIHETYRVKAGDNVLVHAAAGGMGLLLVQWLKHLGATIIGTVSSEEKATVAKEAGADHVILYTQQDFVAETLRLTNGKGADYIIDGIGKDTFIKDLAATRVRGTICLYGHASGLAEPITANAFQAKSLSICGGYLMNHIATHEELIMKSNLVLEAIKKGFLKLNIDQILPLEKAADAHRRLESRQSVGKIILAI